MVGREAAGSNHAVDVWMKLQALIPTMEHTEKAHLGAEMARITSDFKQGLGTRVKEQVIDDPFVL
jgi:hypothetical protein